MKVILAESAGFCSGVKSALRVAVDAARHQPGIFASGPLIHNSKAVRLLALRGIVSSAEQPAAGKAVLIRAHGAPPAERQAWLAAGHPLVDATCCHVASNFNLAANAAAAGRTVIVAGDRDHPEVLAILGHAGKTARLVSTPQEASTLTVKGEAVLLAQTTFSNREFTHIADILRQRLPDLQVHNTICQASERRQAEARELAEQVEVMLVVGDPESANSRRLAEAAREAGKPVFLIPDANHLDSESLQNFRLAGVTAGASTPGWITQAVAARLLRLGKKSFRNHLESLLHFLPESRLSTAFAAAGLTLGCQYLAEIPRQASLAAAAGLYVFFAHLLNRRVPDDHAVRIISGIDPFYNRHRTLLLLFAWTAVLLSLGLALQNGVASLFVPAVLATLLLARRLTEKMPLLHPLRRHPASLAIFTALGWSLTIAGPVCLASWPDPRGLATVLYVFFFVFGRTIIRDLADVDSDHLLGIATLPVAWSENKARLLMVALIGIAMAIPLGLGVGACLSQNAPPAWLLFTLLLSGLTSVSLWFGQENKWASFRDPLRQQTSLDAIGCLTGLLACLFPYPP
ncbi:MAG: 4-hydroxy-3-methylbut-2-enyl diphosphate reductase [Planctomycetota bacterium]|jgi:4-hydroxy-3-methylbut-2-enyl diphosphate reductase|nr:4-hydroxy-3-methylbut-2-enyl diphosphate reductase [Planctomycetota bacterium]